jgi:hypothetical protein
VSGGGKHTTNQLIYYDNAKTDKNRRIERERNPEKGK